MTYFKNKRPKILVTLDDDGKRTERRFQYLPKHAILLIAQHYHEEVISMFRQLMVNENVDTRIKKFKLMLKNWQEIFSKR